MKFRLPTFRSPVARALVPVLGGLVFFGVLFGVTWLLAELATDRAGESRTAQFGTFVVGNVEDIAESIAESGPVLYPDLRDATGERSIIIEHFGEDPAKGWQVYYAYPADRTAECLVTQVASTHQFQDCEGRVLDVTELAAPTDVRPIVENRETLLIDLSE
jgi:hypothetical protein